MPKRKLQGFTIVELVIVIIIIAILAVVTFSIYTNSRKDAVNAARINELQAWVQTFDIYKARKGVYPRQTDLSSSGACLGTGFPNGSDSQPRCRELTVNPGYSYTEAQSASLMSDLSSAAEIPPADKIPAGKTKWIVGPWVEFFPTGSPPKLTITTAIDSTDGHECTEAGLTISWNDANGTYFCTKQILY